MSINDNTYRLVLAAMLMEMTQEQKKRMGSFLWHLHQHGSCGDGAFDRAVQTAHNRDCDLAEEIVKNPFTLLRG